MARRLYGGAVECSGIPDDWLDVSAVRPVPDHQEVFMARDSDDSVIVELVDESGHTLAEHFAEVADINASSQSQILEQHASWLLGSQCVRSQTNVWLYLGIIHWPQHGADLLVTVQTSDPERIADAKSIGQELLQTLRLVDLSLFHH